MKGERDGGRRRDDGIWREFLESIDFGEDAEAY
jgi:hypothetical protein